MGKEKTKLNPGLQKRNIEAYKELFFKYHSRLVLFANKFTDDIGISQDIVQDAFLKLWEKSEDLPNIKSPKAYLFQAVKNSCLNHQRHLNIRHTAEEAMVFKLKTIEKSVYFDKNDPFQSLFEREVEEIVEQLINEMPEKCRVVYKMSRKELLKNKEIAEKLGISIKMVEKHISKALSILRSGLSEYLGAMLLFYLNSH